MSTVVLAIVQQHKAKRQGCAHPFNICHVASVFGGPYILLLNIVQMWCRSVTAYEGQVDAEVDAKEEAGVTEPNDENPHLSSQVHDLVPEAHAASSGESCAFAAWPHTLAQVWKDCFLLLNRQLIADSDCAAGDTLGEDSVFISSDSSCHPAGQLPGDGSLMHR